MKIHAAIIFAIVACITGAMPHALASPAAAEAAHAEPNLSGVHDFDFQFGEWRVHHRHLNAKTGEWVESEGTCTTRKVMNGFGNVEDNVFNPPSGTYRAVGLRAYDPKDGQWSIWWLDGRGPQNPLDPPVRGHFENGVGSFYSDDVVDGKSVRTRYQWSRITPTLAHWEQATSKDAGKSWDTNWVMEFRRTGN